MRRPFLSLLLLVALLLPLVTAIPVAADNGTNWTAEYFTNRNLTGSPIHVRLDSAIAFDWGKGSPLSGLIPVDNFSVRWTGVQNFAGGEYTFSASSDDGVRVWVNSQLLIDAWVDQEANIIHEANITLTPGSHWVKVEYYEAADNARIFVSWRDVNIAGTGSWAAEYYNNRDLRSPQVAGRTESAVDYNWGGSSPFPGTVNADNFSARWWGFPVLERGIYEFVAGADDGIRVWVAGNLLIDKWEPTVYQEHSATLEVETAGAVTVQIEYYEYVDQARVKLYWRYIGPLPDAIAPPEPVPPPAAMTGMVTTFRLNVRRGPGTQYGVIDKINLNETYPVVGRSEDTLWVQISGPSGTGWVAKTYMSLSGDINALPVGQPDLSQPSGVLMAQSNASLRVRRGPGTNNARIAALPAGSSAQVIGRNAASSWLEIRKQDGQEGWIFYNSTYVSLVGDVPLPNIPITG